MASGMQAQGRRAWQGVVVSDENPEDKVEIAIELSAAYRPFFQYETRSGPREVEITQVGQVIQFVPPDGGVRTVRVEELQASRARVHVVLASRFEQTSGGVLEQSWTKTTQTLVGEGDAYRATFQVASGTRLSDLDNVVGGDVETTVYRGVLRPQ